MAYVDTPIATDAKGKSQGEIQQNFIEIQTLVDVDHETFSSANVGKHLHVTLPENTPTVTLENEVQLYAKETDGNSALWLRLEDYGVTPLEYNLTPSVAGHATTGYEILPSGLKFTWGTVTINSGATSGSLPLATEVTTLYGFSFGARSANASITTAKNITITTKSIATALGVTTLTLTRGGTDDTVYFDFILIGK